MTCQNLVFHCIYEHEQGISFVLEFINFANLDESLIHTSHVDCGHFNLCVVDLTIP